METDPAQPEVLTATLQSARTANLAVRALVRAGRRKPAKDANRANLDLNLLGETSAEFLGRALASGIAPRSPWDYMNRTNDVPNPALSDMERQRERGDWLDPDSPDFTQSVQAAVSRLSRTPGLAGIIISDVVPPGYSVIGQAYFGADGALPGAQGGYSDTRRREFVRRFHVDPVDLSPIGSNGFNSYNLRFRQNNYTQFNLPFFPDYGPGASGMTINGQKATELGAGNALQEWNRFRADSAETALSRLQKTFAGNAVPVWFYRNPSDSAAGFGAPFSVESRDKTVSEADAKPAPPPTPGQSYNPFTPNAAQRARSSALLIALDMVAFSGFTPYPNVDGFLLMTSYLFDPKSTPLKNWDGLVLDMTGETLPAATSHIESLPVPSPPAPASSGKTPGKAARP